MNSPPALLGALAATAVTSVGWFLAQKRRNETYPLPPSPFYWPVVGNLPSMPTADEHIGFMKLGEELNSNIFSLNIFGTLIIVLNSAEDATNLLDKRSGTYSDRACPPMVKEPSLMNWPGFASLLGYNDVWRKSRRLMHTWLHKKAAERFHASQQAQARLLLKRLLQRSASVLTSENLDLEFFRTTAATLVDSIYGYNLQSETDPFVLELKVAMDHIVDAAMTSNFLVNLFPVLVHVPEWFPGAGWKRTAREWREQKDYAVDTTYNWTKQQMANGTNKPSIIASSLGNAEQMGIPTNEVDYYLKDVAATLLAGGTDTTTNTLLVFILAMLMFPDTQRKAQEEIDSVVGSSRLPTMADRPRLEYVQRILHELIRWLPVVPGGLPHVCYRDDIYKGYRIPKGALVFSNVWAICRNPIVYPNPEEFNPDRFLDPKVPTAPTFGYGRRICPGMHFADSSLFIAIVSILATFDICLAKGEDGKYIEPVLSEGSRGVVYRPEPFKAVLRPRSRAHIDLINGDT